MSFYSDIATEADSLIREYGAAAILRRTGLDVYDPTTGTTLPNIDIETPIFAVVLDYDERAIAGTLIQVGDKKVIMSAVGIDPPRLTDQFVWVDGTYTVIHPIIYAPNGENVLYELQVRK